MSSSKNIKNSDDYINTLIDQIENKNRRGLAKAISIVEDEEPGYEILLDYAYKKEIEPTLVVGITGPGGVGKSTLTDQMLRQYRSQDKTIGVIAVDPSSPYSGGAFLGDRVRMGKHNQDDKIFIRSFGSRGSQGGISEGAKNVLYLYKAFGFDVILVESLGIGQDETEITMFVDVSVLVMVPGLGDIFQMLKAGIREAADIFIINKSDKPEAAVIRDMLENSFDIIPEEMRPPIISTIASEGTGVDEALIAITEEAIKLKRFEKSKLQKRYYAEISSVVINLVRDTFVEPINILTEEVLAGSLTPFEASKKIVDCVKIDSWEKN